MDCIRWISATESSTTRTFFTTAFTISPTSRDLTSRKELQVRSHLRHAFANCDLYVNCFRLRRLRTYGLALRAGDGPLECHLRLSLRFFLIGPHLRSQR